MIMKILLEDTIMVKGLPCTAGSKALENFIAPFDAAVVEKLKSAGFEIETCAAPEFGLGDILTHFPRPPVLKNDVFGTVRQQVLQYNFAYLYPSYGRVSRYGLVPSVSSMDQIGIAAEKPEDCFSLLEIISGYDERDGMSISNAQYTNQITNNNNTSQFSILNSQLIKIGKFQSSLPLSDAFTILAAAEFANNVSRYDGVKFGYRAKNYKNVNDLYVKSRTESFGIDAKLYSILGNIVLSHGYYDKYYDKAMRIRRMIRDALADALKACDVVEVSPVATEHAALSPLTGFPSLTFVKNGVPTAVFAKPFDEKALYKYIELIVY